jgi:digalactosyldiacylglycerol synthase
VIVEDHPSNKFFSGFSNCLTYQTPEQFSSHLKHALKHDPKPVCPLFPPNSEADTVS